MTETRSRWIWAVCSMALVSLPFLAVDLIPSTDLPQHLGQLRLFSQAWANPDGPLEIQWWTPYGLVYGLLAIPWAILPPIAAGWRLTIKLRRLMASRLRPKRMYTGCCTMLMVRNCSSK